MMRPSPANARVLIQRPLHDGAGGAIQVKVKHQHVAGTRAMAAAKRC